MVMMSSRTENTLLENVPAEYRDTVVHAFNAMKSDNSLSETKQTGGRSLMMWGDCPSHARQLPEELENGK